MNDSIPPSVAYWWIIHTINSDSVDYLRMRDFLLNYFDS